MGYFDCFHHWLESTNGKNFQNGLLKFILGEHKCFIENVMTVSVLWLKCADPLIIAARRQVSAEAIQDESPG